MAEKSTMRAVNEALANSKDRKFTETVEIAVNLKDVDLSIPKNRINEEIILPHGRGTDIKIAVIGTHEMAGKAKEVADLFILSDELEEYADDKRKGRHLANGYEFFIAEAPLMPLIGKRLGIFLGPRGKMPIPVPPAADITSLIAKHRKTISLRMRNQPILQSRVGMENMKDEEIAENIQAVLSVLEGKLKRGLKNIKFAYIKTAMGTPTKIKP